MKNIQFLCIIFLLPLVLNAQVKSFELTNPEAIQLTDSCLKLLTSQAWQNIQIETDVRGTLTKFDGTGVLNYSDDGTFTYRRSGVWEIIEGKYIKHEFEDEIEKEINFGGIYAVSELTDSVLTITKLLTSSHDMKRTMYFRSTKISPIPKHSARINPIFSAPINYYEGKTDAISLDSISNLSMEALFMNDYIVIRDTIYIHTQDSLYRIKRKSN